MRMSLFNWLLCILLALPTKATVLPDATRHSASPYVPLRSTLRDETTSCSLEDPTSPVADLGYEIYEGFDAGSGTYTWNKIRYAAPPTGTLRWQPPSSPVTSRNPIISATAAAHSYRCPYAFPNMDLPISDKCGDLSQNSISPDCRASLSEDCLFLNVIAPKNATNLPVMVFVHGGGYASGDGNMAVNSLLKSNGNQIVVVTLQYRLGAFGFLASPYTKDLQSLNVGLQDQQFALKWVQSNICKFGGDPSQVTLAGQSAGGSSVLYQALAQNGTLSNSLFRNVIAASPYIPWALHPSDDISISRFEAFAHELGCDDFQDALDCLRKKGTDQLQVANQRISKMAPYRHLAFIPVVDGTFLAQPPSRQLLSGNLNGERVLTGHNANEGATFVAQNISTIDDVVDYLSHLYPRIDKYDLFEAYDATSVLFLPEKAPGQPALFATDGLSPLKQETALIQSSLGDGVQQFLNNIYAEATFVCPSYWLADAFARKDLDAFKYQYSIPPGIHAQELSSFFFSPANFSNRDFQRATQKMWGNFVRYNNPSVSNLVANGLSRNSSAPNPASSWKKWTLDSRNMLNLNESGGQPSFWDVRRGSFRTLEVPIHTDPGLTNKFDLVDAVPWEGGRGARCDFWMREAQKVPM